MYFLSNLKNLLTDFLFPKSKSVSELEKLDESELIEKLPSAEKLENKNTVAIFSYADTVVKKLIWELKYNGNNLIAEKLGKILYDHIRQELIDLSLFEKWENPILIPIPISDKRRFERGWNQTELLAEKIIKLDKEKNFSYAPNQLIKTRNTVSQTKTLTKTERLKNLNHSMEILNKDFFKNSCVVLIDDVTTTGSTFQEASRVLVEAGVKRILCVAIAH